MVDVEQRFERRGGVTYVRATVTNTFATPQCVCLESRLDGPTWPPRHGVVFDPAWSGQRWSTTIKPGRCRGMGFASPAEPVAEPLELRSVARANDTHNPIVDQTLARLDGWSPPSDVCFRAE